MGGGVIIKYLANGGEAKKIILIKGFFKLRLGMMNPKYALIYKKYETCCTNMLYYAYRI